VKLNQPKLAVESFEKGLEIGQYCFGKDHPEYLEEFEILEKMKMAVANKKPFDQTVIQWFDDRIMMT
jgi:hypothetical protein